MTADPLTPVRAFVRVTAFAILLLLLFVFIEPFCIRLLSAITGMSAGSGNAREIDAVAIIFRWVDVALILLVMKGAALRERVAMGLAYGLPLRRDALRQAGLGAAFGILAVAVVCGVLILAHTMRLGAPALTVGEGLGYGLRWGIAFLAVAAMEEILFRGYPLVTLARGIGFWPASLLLSALFTAAHLRNAGESSAGLFAVFLFGMLFCVMKQRTGALWYGIGLHAGWDWAQSFLFGVPDSGTVARGRAFVPSIDGVAWLTGGTAGPEASAITLALLLGALYLLTLRPGPRMKATLLN